VAFKTNIYVHNFRYIDATGCLNIIFITNKYICVCVLERERENTPLTSNLILIPIRIFDLNIFKNFKF
jgi:hypothetical protein